MAAHELIQARDPGPGIQKGADQLVPLGWCNICVGKAKQAVADGAPVIPAVSAAVTLVARVQFMSIPGAGSMPAVITLPACWACIEVSKTSTLQTATGLGIPQ